MDIELEIKELWGAFVDLKQRVIDLERRGLKWKMDPEKIRELRFSLIMSLLKEDPELLNMIVAALEKAQEKKQ